MLLFLGKYLLTLSKRIADWQLRENCSQTAISNTVRRHAYYIFYSYLFNSLYAVFVKQNYKDFVLLKMTARTQITYKGAYKITILNFISNRN